MKKIAEIEKEFDKKFEAISEDDGYGLYDIKFFYRHQIKAIVEGIPDEKQEPKNEHQTMYCRGFNQHCRLVSNYKQQINRRLE